MVIPFKVNWIDIKVDIRVMVLVKIGSDSLSKNYSLSHQIPRGECRMRFLRTSSVLLLAASTLAITPATMAQEEVIEEIVLSVFGHLFKAR